MRSQSLSLKKTEAQAEGRAFVMIDKDGFILPGGGETQLET